jgi:hypothetical protein
MQLICRIPDRTGAALRKRARKGKEVRLQGVPSV